MTTIAISKKHNMIACDGRQTIDSMIITDKSNKILKLKKDDIDFIIAFAGESEAKNEFEKDFEDNPQIGLSQLLVNLKVKEWSCLIYVDDLIYIASSKYRKPCEIKTDHWAIGSGEEYAITSMDLGNSPIEAIKNAKARDVFTGGKIFKEALI